MKYIILADNNKKEFKTPKQLTEVNGEPLIKRTIRLLKENGVEDIIITSHDKRFDNLGAERYEPLNNHFSWDTGEGYWLDAFTYELLNEPVTFLFGDVYFSEKAIKTIIESETDSTLLFCSYENQNDKYIKEYDETFAYKVVDYELFKKHIDILKEIKDSGTYWREPIVWELYRSINNQDIGYHQLTKNYVIINDETEDIDSVEEIELIKNKLE